MRDTRFTTVAREPELDAVVVEARRARRIALDTEFMRERTYRARLCLIQIATPSSVYVVDPVDGLDLRPIAGLLSDGDIEILVHAGRQDFELFVERFGSVPQCVFDVQLAAGFVGLGSSLPYGRLIEETVGVRLVKGESYTDWCKRPLTEAQLSYAADDVRYLFSAADEIAARLARLGRTSWVEEEMAQFHDPRLYASEPSDAWRRVSGRGSLSGRGLAILREVAAWREEVAARRDIPRGWVIKDPTLIEIARRAPTSERVLTSLRGMNAREVERSGRELLEAVRRGLDARPIQTPPAPPKAALARARMLSGLADAVLRARCEHNHMAPELVATKAELEAVLIDAFKHEPAPEAHRLLRGWRRELAGDAVLALASGRLAVKVIEEPPYVEEVPLVGERG